MKRRKQNKKKSDQEFYKCTTCGSVLSSLNEYQNHVAHKLECKRNLP